MSEQIEAERPLRLALYACIVAAGLFQSLGVMSLAFMEWRAVLFAHVMVLFVLGMAWTLNAVDLALWRLQVRMLGSQKPGAASQ